MIHVCDDFFKNPYAIRSIALKEKYSGEGFNNPGFGSRHMDGNISDYMESKVRYLTQDKSLELLRCSFRFTTKEYKTGIYHHDGEDSLYNVIVFLSLDPPPHSGTEISDAIPSAIEWKKILDSFSDCPGMKCKFHESPKNFINSYKYGRLVKQVNSLFDRVMEVPNKFNRCLIFPSEKFHRAQDFFGTSKENSRLTLISFFK